MKLVTAAMAAFLAISSFNTAQAHMPERCTPIALALAFTMQAMGKHAKKADALAPSWTRRVRSSDPVVLRGLVADILEFMEPFGTLGQEQMNATGKFADCVAGK